MSRLAVGAVALALLILVPASAPAAPVRFAPGRVLVALDPSSAALRVAPDGRPLAADMRLAAVLARHGLDHARELPGRAPDGLPRYLVLTSARPDFDPERAAAELRASGAVRAAAPDVLLRRDATLPNDPYRAAQWAVSSPIDADVQLPEAWDLGQGSASVVIAIVDLGVDTGHPDLTGKMWSNPGETLNGIDDDGDGLVDDVQGWDFGGNDNDPNPHAVYDPASGVDVGFHGTFLAGIAAASTNNGEGICGAGWNCRIMNLKIVDTAGEMTLSAAAAGIQYATAKHADVLNMSFGTPDDSLASVSAMFQTLMDAANAAGVVCVASAGNDSTDSLRYPAANAGVIAVAATDSTGKRAWFSNYGAWVDVAAPGAGIWSSICRNYPFDFGSELVYYLYFGWDTVHPYMYGDGTSFAAPLVSGICGLLRARAPGLTPQQVRDRLVATGDAVAYDKPIGPKVNAYRALQGAVGIEAPLAAGVLQLSPAVPNPVRGATTLRFLLPAAGDASLVVYDPAGRRVRELVRGARAAGPQSASWDGRDGAGVRVPSGVYFARLESGARLATTKLVVLE